MRRSWCSKRRLMQRRFVTSWTSFSFVLAAVSFLFADESATSGVGSLIGSLEQLAQRPPDGKQMREAARQRLSSSVERLEQFLARGKNETAARWSHWLDLPTLREQLAAEQPDLTALKPIEERLYQNRPGLELPAFLAVRKDLATFQTVTEYAAASTPEPLYQQRV